MEAVRRQKELLLLWHDALHTLQVLPQSSPLLILSFFSEATLLSNAQALRDASDCIDESTVSAQVCYVHASHAAADPHRQHLQVAEAARADLQSFLLRSAASS
jgi:hypothetical protein